MRKLIFNARYANIRSDMTANILRSSLLLLMMEVIEQIITVRFARCAPGAVEPATE